MREKLPRLFERQLAASSSVAGFMPYTPSTSNFLMIPGAELRNFGELAPVFEGAAAITARGKKCFCAPSSPSLFFFNSLFFFPFLFSFFLFFLSSWSIVETPKNSRKIASDNHNLVSSSVSFPVSQSVSQSVISQLGGVGLDPKIKIDPRG